MQLYNLITMLVKMILKPRTINWLYWGPVLTFTFLYVALLMEFFVVAFITLTR